MTPSFLMVSMMVRETPLFPLSLSLIVCFSFLARSASFPTGGKVITTRFVTGWRGSPGALAGGLVTPHRLW
jgi:hypothetical protein